MDQAHLTPTGIDSYVNIKYNESMQLYHPERNFLHLFLFLIFASMLGWFINSFPPELLWHFAGFYCLLGLTIFFFTQFVLCNIRRSMLISLCVVILFLLRAFNLRHPLYIALLVACLFSIEYSFTRQKRVK